jgi:hypothetical protein
MALANSVFAWVTIDKLLPSFTEKFANFFKREK